MSAKSKELKTTSGVKDRDQSKSMQQESKDNQADIIAHKSDSLLERNTKSGVKRANQKDSLPINMSPSCNDLLQNNCKVEKSLIEVGRSLNLSSPMINNKISISVSPAQNDYFPGFQKDEFQLKNSSDEKNLKMIDFSYSNTLLSKSNSSKKVDLVKIVKNNHMEDEGSLKRRLFEKDSSEYEADENSNYNILGHNDALGYVENLITPPPKTKRRVTNVLTDQKLSGAKYLIPFCNK